MTPGPYKSSYTFFIDSLRISFAENMTETSFWDYEYDPMGSGLPHPAPMPTRFWAEGRPQDHFVCGYSSLSPRLVSPYLRFIKRNDDRTILLFVDGSCLNNGRADARAGWSVVFHPEQPDAAGNVHGRLENRGPSGDLHPQTNNRAELRAVLAALQFRYWPGENVRTLVLATDSTYVANGCTRLIHDWEANYWMTARETLVENRDLWMALLDEFRRRASQGLTVKFWRIPREWNTEADHYARIGATQDAKPYFSKVFGTGTF